MEFLPSALKNIVCTRLNIFSGKRRRGTENILAASRYDCPHVRLFYPGYQRALEIGYGLNEEYRGAWGIMTKVVKQFVPSSSRVDIEKIVASTENRISPPGVSSLKSGFVRHSGSKNQWTADFAFVQSRRGRARGEHMRAARTAHRHQAEYASLATGEGDSRLIGTATKPLRGVR